jgi:hypothetical protein
MAFSEFVIKPAISICQVAGKLTVPLTVLVFALAWCMHAFCVHPVDSHVT